MKIWFVSIFENTPIDDNLNTRYNSFVREALNRGHHVEFWASTFKHNVKRQRFEEDSVFQPQSNLKIHFIKSRSYTKNISFKRLWSHYKLSKDMVMQFNEVEKPDLIVMAYPPISLGFEISRWAKKNNVPFIVDIIDPWPQVFIEQIKTLPKPLLKILLYPLSVKASKTFRNSDGIMAISNQYLTWVSKSTKDIKQQRCFYPAIDFDAMQLELSEASKRIQKDSSKFKVIYAGSLGYSYDISTILLAAKELSVEYNDIEFVIAGDGPQRELIEEYVNEYSNLTYIGRVPKNRLVEEYYTSHIGLTQHTKGATQSVTYKLFDLLSCGLPIINSLESEMKDIILDNKVGFHHTPGDFKQLAASIIRLYKDRDLLTSMQENAIELTKRLGDSKVVYKQALDFMSSVAIRKS